MVYRYVWTYTLIEKKGKTTNLKKATTTKTKDKHTQFGFALYYCFLLRNVLDAVKNNCPVLVSGLAVPCLDINNSGGKKRERDV